MRSFILALAVCWAAVGLVSFAPAQEPGDPPRTAKELFQDARGFIQEGRYDQAAEELKKFLAANPTDQDFFDLQRRDSTIFLKLRNVPVWSDNTAAQTAATQAVEAIIKRAEQANATRYRDPARITKFVHNLGATLEERIYAEQELRKGGDAVVPIMVNTLQGTLEVPLRAGILLAIHNLGIETVPGFLAAVEGLSPELKHGVLQAIITRDDLLTLLSFAETDFAPYLWHYAAATDSASQPLREFSLAALEQFSGKQPSRVRSEAELVRIAENFATHQARFRGNDAIEVWSWDAAKLTVVKAKATKQQAEDYFALRYTKWALEANQNYEEAQDLFLQVSVTRAVEKGRFRDLAEADPLLYQVLATVPSTKVNEQAAIALNRKETAYALGLIGALATRADKAAATAGEGRQQGVFLRGLDYSDVRVQFASAIGLLRAPVPPNHGKTARVVDVLRRAISAETSDGTEMGRALIADPVGLRADKLAGYLLKLGYTSERVTTGRELMRRVARAADFDLIVVDQHVVDPLLADLLPQLQTNANVASRPVLVIASSEKPRPIPLEHLLLRLAVLIGVSETSGATVPSPFAFDPRVIVKDVDATKAKIAVDRDRMLTLIYEERLARLQRLVTAAGLPYSKNLEARLHLRLPQVTYAAMAAEYPISLDSAPEMSKRFNNQNLVISNQPDLSLPLSGIPEDALSMFAERIESGLSEANAKRFNAYYSGIDTQALGFPPDNLRDLDLEAALKKSTAGYPIVTVVPEPFRLEAFTQDIQAAVADPAALPRDPKEKMQAARTAIDWLRRLAVGEIPGYDIRPAEPTLRAALRNDELAPDALEALVRISTAEAQQDMINLAITGGRPEPIRSKAAGLAIQHIQNYGNLTPKNLVDATVQAQAKTNELKSKLLVIHQLLAGKATDRGELMVRYPLPTPKPTAPPAPPMLKVPAMP